MPQTRMPQTPLLQTPLQADLTDHVCLGAFAGAFGVRGEVRIKPFTDDPLAIGGYGPVRTKEGRSLVLKSVRPGKNGFVTAALEGVADRDEADALKGQTFHVPRSVLPEPDEEDAFYHADLIGLDAVLVDASNRPPGGTSAGGTSDGVPDGAWGQVTAVPDYGAGDLLEIRLTETGRLVLVPFTKAVVPVVDIKAGRVLVNPPDGLLEPGSGEPDEAEGEA